MHLIIGNKNYSSWSLRPWLLLQQFGLDFEETKLALFSESFKSRVSQYDAAGKVPVLKDGDFVVWDSLAICEYVSDKYLFGKGWPSDPQARAIARPAASEMHSGFFAVRTDLPMNCQLVDQEITISDALRADIERIDQLWQQLKMNYGQSGPYLCGEFSIVDCMFAPVVLRLNSYQTGVEMSVVSRAYCQKILTNNAVKKWCAEASEEELMML